MNCPHKRALRSFECLIKKFAVRMDYTNPGFWIALMVGGSLAALLSAFHQYTSTKSKESFRYRAVFRDFCIGAFLTAAVYMFLPESITKWISETLPLQSVKLEQSGGSVLSSDIELQVGPARF